MNISVLLKLILNFTLNQHLLIVKKAKGINLAHSFKN